MKTTLEILLDNDLYNGKGIQPTFTPGQAITGRVVYTPTSRKNIEDVSILLLGRCVTVITRAGFGKDSYTEDIELFRLKKTLLKGPFTMQATTTEWQFSFVLPMKTTFTRNGGEDNWLYETQAHQLVPSIMSTAHGHEATINYSLRVVINSGHLRGSEDWKLPIAVTICSKATLPEPESVRCDLEVIKELRLKQPTAEKINFRQKMGRVFSKDSVHHIAFPFHIEAYMPDVCGISQVLSVSISVRPSRSDKGGVPTALSLLGASLELISKIHVRVQTRVGDLDEKIWEDFGQHKLVDSESDLPLYGEPIELSSVRLVDLVHEEARRSTSTSQA